MKKKVTKIKSDPDLVKHMQGYGTFRITGPSTVTGERVTKEFYGLRTQAEKYILK